MTPIPLPKDWPSPGRRNGRKTPNALDRALWRMMLVLIGRVKRT